MARRARTAVALVASALFAAAFALTAAPPALADNPKTLEIGSPAPEFNLPGVDGRQHKLADYADAKVLVVVFTCNHCPTAQAYEGRIKALAKDYHDKGVAVVAISPNDDKAIRLDELGYTDLSDSFAEMKQRAKAHGFSFPYLYDGQTQTVSHAYGAVATPHIFVFDAQRRLQYQGRIDNNENPAKADAHDARDAIEAVLAGKPAAVKTTRVFGCSVKWSQKRESAKESLAKWDQEKAELADLDAAGVKKLMAQDSKKYRLVNVWATWCGPCVAEFPDLVEMHRMYRRRPFELVTISLDSPKDKDKALKFLNEQHASMTNYIYTGDDRDALADTLDKAWRGPVPHTVLIGPDGKVVWRHTGAIDPLEVKRAIVEHIGRTYF
jgi:peroxiredoxin